MALVILLPPVDIRIPVTFVGVIAALVMTGVLSARVGGANATRATIRVAIGGAFAMIVTYSIGKLFNVNGI